MARKRDERELDKGLDLRTLSGVYESGRSVVRLIDMSRISTYSQLAQQLASLAKNKDAVHELFDAFERLRVSTLRLGLVTLVKPADHPLVIRERLPEEEE